MPANLFAAIRPEEVGANHVGKFICRYSPVCMGRGAWMTNDVGANHAGELIRPESVFCVTSCPLCALCETV